MSEVINIAVKNVTPSLIEAYAGHFINFDNGFLICLSPDSTDQRFYGTEADGVIWSCDSKGNYGSEICKWISDTPIRTR